MSEDVRLFASRPAAGSIEVGASEGGGHAEQHRLHHRVASVRRRDDHRRYAGARSRQARYRGRAAVGVLFIAGGALLHVINLATGGDYAGFANPAHFAWVTHAWNAVVVPNHVLFIGLLAAFEAIAGVLANQRRAQDAAGTGTRLLRLGWPLATGGWRGNPADRAAETGVGPAGK